MILPAEFQNVASARKAVRVHLRAVLAPEEAVSLGELAMGELVANAIRHGSGAAVEFTLRVNQDEAIVAVTNVGPVFKLQTPQLTAMTSQESGRGLAMLEALGCALSIDATNGDRCTVTALVPLVRAPRPERS